MGILSTVIGVLPFVGAIVQGIESLFGHGSGAQKKTAAMGAISAGLGAFGAATGNQLVISEAPEAEQAISELIDAAVKVYNVLGVFTHKTAPAPAAG